MIFQGNQIVRTKGLPQYKKKINYKTNFITISSHNLYEIFVEFVWFTMSFL